MAVHTERRIRPARRSFGDINTVAIPYSRWINSGIEWLWLAAVILVPLIVFPDSEFVSRVGIAKTFTLRLIASGIGILLAADLAIGSISSLRSGAAPGRHRIFPDRYAGWLLQPRGMVIAGFALLAIVTFLSSAMSIQPSVSFWGKEPGNEGYDLYSTAALWTIALAIGLKLRRREQVWRLLGALSLSGLVLSVGAMAQRVSIWPVHETFYLDRSTANLGNPISLGAFLILVFPLAMTMVYLHGFSRLSRWRWTALAVAVAFLFLYAMQLTLSRGPYLAAGAQLIVFGLLWWRYRGRRAARDMFMPVGLAVGLVILASFGQLLSAEWTSTDEPEVYDSSLERTAGHSTLDSRIATQSTISYRIDNWVESTELVGDRPQPGDEGKRPALARHLLGYGPDTFRYVLPFTASGTSLNRLTSSAHNELINRTVETGWLGLIGFLLVVAAAVRVLFTSARSSNRAVSLLSIAIIAALAGRVVEQLTGVARNSDSLVFWVLVALAFVIPIVFRKGDETAEGTVAGEAGQGGEHNSKPGFLQAATPPLVLGVSFALVVMVSWMAWQKTIVYTAADHDVAEARSLWSVDAIKALEKYDSAIARAPDVIRYRNEKSDLLLAMAELEAPGLRQNLLFQQAYDTDLEAQSIRPYDRFANFKLAASAWNLALAGVPGKAEETVAVYERLAVIAPEHELVAPRLAQLYEATGLEPGSVGAK